MPQLIRHSRKLVHAIEQWIQEGGRRVLEGGRQEDNINSCNVINNIIIISKFVTISSIFFIINNIVTINSNVTVTIVSPLIVTPTAAPSPPHWQPQHQQHYHHQKLLKKPLSFITLTTASLCKTPYQGMDIPITKGHYQHQTSPITPLAPPSTPTTPSPSLLSVLGKKKSALEVPNHQYINW